MPFLSCGSVSNHLTKHYEIEVGMKDTYASHLEVMWYLRDEGLPSLLDGRVQFAVLMLCVMGTYLLKH